jgi:homoserine dehydrogenase
MKKLKIGLAGLGTVGKGVYEILKKDAKILEARSQTSFEIVAVSARSRKDFVDPKIRFYANAADLANDAEIDVVIEVIGGTEIAKELLELSVKNGKKFITANKALLAEFGSEIAELVEQHGAFIGFEASTAGANPVIKNFKESFVAGEITDCYAILNGTCNFTLSKMTNEGLDFAETLLEAQKLGYAEVDPTLDIKGIDTAHKLTILAAIASSKQPAFKQLHIEGIDQISIQDVKLASELGYKIKLLGIYKKLGDSVQQAVYPALLKKSEKLAQIDGPFNAVLTNSSNASWNLSVGRGAGSLPTASAVIADLIDIACNRSSFLFGVESSRLSKANILNISQRVGKYFLRLLIDKKSAQKTDLAEAVFGSKIKVEQVVLIDAGDEILCGFLTDEQKEEDLLEVLSHLDSNLVKAAKFLRVEETNF